MIWGYLVERPTDRLNITLLTRACKAGHLEVVGSLAIEEEMLGVSSTSHPRYKRMRLNYNRLTNGRVLIPLRERVAEESRHLGAIPTSDRYFDAGVQAQLRRQAYDRVALRELAQQVHDQKEEHRAHDAAARDLARTQIRDEILLASGSGLNSTSAEHGSKRLAKMVNREVAEWYRTVDIDDWLGDIAHHLATTGLGGADGDANASTMPTAWLTTAYRMCRIKRHIADNRKVQPSDWHDAEHVIAGIYYDTLVTNDNELRETLVEIVDLPFAVSTPDEFTDILVRLLSSRT